MDIVYSVLSFIVGVGVVAPYIVKLRNLLSEVVDLIETVKDAPEGGISAEDTAAIKKEAAEVWVAIKAFGKKDA